MNTVKDVLDQKGRTVFSIEAGETVLDAIEMMVAKDVAALVVIDGDTGVAGIITERDYARKVPLNEKSPREIAVRERHDQRRDVCPRRDPHRHLYGHHESEKFSPLAGRGS